MGLFKRAPKGPAKYVIRYSHENGQYREINLRADSEQAALEVAGRRLREQYGDGVFEREAREAEAAGDGRVLAEANLLRANPALHQDNYVLDFVKRED